jgi:DNA-binding transcriptional ArsR family regulator
MVWRIHFTADDLARIQVSPTLGPLAETVMALSLLRCPSQSRSAFGGWRSQVQGKVTPQMAALMALLPAGSAGVDLCTLTGEAPTIEQGVQALLTVPREHLLVEMEYADRDHRLPAAAWAMAEPSAREQLADSARAAYRALIEPYWSRIHARLHEDPNDEGAAPRLVLPAAGDGPVHLWDGPRPRGALAALVGRNRAAALGAIADGCTTTELAERVGISLAAASQHASVLRGAGLIASRRQGSAVLHVLTPLGAELLRAQ